MTRNTIFGFVVLIMLRLSLSACTIAAISPEATVSGKPILWKNRDVGQQAQTVRYFTDGPLSFLAIIYVAQPSRAWAGINDKGFAIINSDSYNLGTWPGDGPDDGQIMKSALSTCATIQDFHALLDSTNIDGRRTAANYGVFDSTGRVVMIEAAPYCYTTFEASDSHTGILVRANFSVSGDPDIRPGYDRYIRARILLESAWLENELDHKFIIQKVSRDLGRLDFDPYPLPFEGEYGGMPYGYLSTANTINRYYTSSVQVLEGNLPYQSPSLCTFWSMLGEAIVAVPVPLWVAADSVPALIDSRTNSPLWNIARELRSIVYSGGGNRTINSFTLSDVLDHFNFVENWIFSCTEVLMEAWETTLPYPSVILNVEQTFAEHIYEKYLEFTPLSTEHASKPPQLISVLRAFPNPFNRKCEIALSVSRESVVNTSIKNLLGETVRQYPPIKLEANSECFIEWDPGHLPTGFYFVQVVSGDNRESIKILYLK